MKKLLAIAVATAITVPMMGTAQAASHGKSGIQMGGQMRFETGATTGANDSTIESKTGKNFLTFGGANPLNRTGAMGTYALKLRFDADSDGTANHGADAITGNIGIKAGPHWLRVGSNTTPMDNTDGIVGFLPSDGGFGDGKSANSLDYTGSYGAVGVQAMYRPEGNDTDTSQVALKYAAGPFAAGVALAQGGTITGGKTRLALAYTPGRYKLGASYDKNQAGDKGTAFGGAVTLGNLTLGASFGKTAGTKFNAEEVSYKLGSKTRVYVSSSKKDGSDRDTALGLEQKF